jgi:hypothetical protein
MRWLADWSPSSWSSLKIFICYATEDRDAAEEIAHTLRNDGHDVFVDAHSLRVSNDFHQDIRRAIAASDRFIFLVSQASIAQGKYTQTELAFAQQRWPSPQVTCSGNFGPIIS